MSHEEKAAPAGAKKRTSGPTQSNEKRRAAGRERVALWLDAEAAEGLRVLVERSGEPKSEVIAGLILRASRRAAKGSGGE